MKAIRKILKSDNNILNISLPPDFCHKEIELIILPYDRKAPQEEKNKLKAYKEFVLNMPIMNDQQFIEWETEKRDLYTWLKS